ncbi:hypothetical protein HDE_10952 [Halotydeus destructor]|nr:hypothetical protein HDE_10952 [Halotydeus destructor]
MRFISVDMILPMLNQVVSIMSLPDFQTISLLASSLDFQELITIGVGFIEEFLTDYIFNSKTAIPSIIQTLSSAITKVISLIPPNTIRRLTHLFTRAVVENLPLIVKEVLKLLSNIPQATIENILRQLHTFISHFISGQAFNEMMSKLLIVLREKYFIDKQCPAHVVNFEEDWDDDLNDEPVWYKDEWFIIGMALGAILFVCLVALTIAAVCYVRRRRKADTDYGVYSLRTSSHKRTGSVNFVAAPE